MPAKRPPQPISVEDLIIQLVGCGTIIDDLEALCRWTPEEREQVSRWSAALFAVASDHRYVRVPPEPSCVAGVLHEVDRDEHNDLDDLLERAESILAADGAPDYPLWDSVEATWPL